MIPKWKEKGKIVEGKAMEGKARQGKEKKRKEKEEMEMKSGRKISWPSGRFHIRFLSPNTLAADSNTLPDGTLFPATRTEIQK